VAWSTDPEKRAKDVATYGSAEYRRNASIVRRRAGGKCEKCGRRARRLEVDHRVPVSATGVPDHSLANLWLLCADPGTNSCHGAKTAQESHAARQAKRPAPRPRTQW